MATLTPEIAQDLIWRSMVTGVPTTEFEKYGGYEAVDAMYKAGGGEYSHDAIPVDLRNQLGQQVAQTGAGNLSILEKTGNALSAAAIENMAKSGTISSLPLFMERGIPIAEAAMPTAQKYLSIMPALSGTLQPTAKPTQPTQQPSLLPPAFSGSGLSIPSAYPSQAQTLDFLSPTGTITPSPQLPVSTLPGYTFSPITTPTVSSIVPSAVPQPQAPVDTQLPSIQQSVQDQFQQRVFGVPRSDIEQFIASRSPQPRVPEYSPMLTPTVSRQQLEQLNRLYGIPQTPPQDDNMQFFREGGAVKKFADGGPSSGVRRLEMSGYKDGGGVSDNPFAQMVEEEQRTQDQLLGNINRQLSELISRYRSGDLTVTEKELLPFFPGYTEYDIAQMYGTTTEATSPRMSEKIKPFTVDMIPNVKRRGEAVESDFDRMVREGKLLDPMMPKRVMELSKGGEVTNDEFIQEMITGTRPEDFPETSPVDKKAGELLRALSEGTRGFVGAEPIEPGSEAYRTGQALANMPAVGVVAATAKGAGKAKNALKSIVDPARLFEEVEKIPRNQIIDDLRNAHIGGVGDFGDSNAKYYFSQIPGGKEYIKKSQQVAKKNLGDRFMGYRLMSKDQFEDLQAGDVGDLLSFSLDQNIAEALRNFVTNQKRTDLVVAEVPLTPKHIVAFGHSGEKEIIVDTGVGWSMDEFKQAAPLKKAKGGEVTNDEFIQEMMVGTAPSEESQQTTGEYIKGLYKENIPVHARVYLETLLGKKDPVTAEDFTKEELARIDSLIQKTEAERLGKILKRQADLQSSLERTTKRLSPQKDIAKKMVEDPDWIAYSELNKKPTSPEVANEQFDAWTRFYNKFADQAFVHEDITLIMGDRDPKKVQSYLDEKKQKNKQTTEYLKDRLSKVNQALDAVQGKGLKGAVEDYSAYGSTSPKEMEDTDISRTLGRFNYETLPSGRRVVKDTYDFYNEYRAPMVEEYEKMGPAKKALSVLLEAVKDPVQLPSVLGNAYIGRDGRPVKVEYDPKDLPVKRQDGSPSQGEISDDMFVGTRPTDETTRPGILPPELREAIDVPLDFANLLIRGTAAVPIGGAAGLYKGITGGKYGTQEGVKEADTEAARMMAKITGEPKTQTAKDVLQFVGDKAQEYKLDAALPQLLTLPSPGPGAASALSRAAMDKGEERMVQKMREITGNPDLTAKQVYDAMFEKQTPGASVVKMPGGNWLKGQVEYFVRSLKRDIPWTQSQLEEMPDVAKAEAPNLALNKFIETGLTRYIKNDMASAKDTLRNLADENTIKAGKAYNNDLRQVKKAYDRAEKIKAEGPRPNMLPGTWENAIEAQLGRARQLEEEANRKLNLELRHALPFPALQEDGGLAGGLNFLMRRNLQTGGEETLVSRRKEAGQAEEGVAQTPTGKVWETMADLFVKPQAAGQITDQDYFMRSTDSQRVLRNNPWLATVPPETPVYIPQDVFRSSSFLNSFSADDLGFKHITDELANAMNPESGLPANLLLTPDEVANMGMEKAARHVIEVNKWREEQMGVANALRAQKSISLYKDYSTIPGKTEPNQRGLQWLELKLMPEDDTPESMVKAKEALADALKYEGEVMGHCVGGECPKVESGKSRIISLRDAKGEPHVTLEVIPPEVNFSDVLGGNPAFPNRDPELYRMMDTMTTTQIEKTPLYKEKAAAIAAQKLPGISQIKGKGNNRPPDSYQPFITDFIASQSWSSVGDLQNTNLVRIEPMILKNAQDRGFNPQIVTTIKERPYITKEEFNRLADLFGGMNKYAAGGEVTDFIKRAA
jgi:hypothetical protein